MRPYLLWNSGKILEQVTREMVLSSSLEHTVCLRRVAYTGKVEGGRQKILLVSWPG